MPVHYAELLCRSNFSFLTGASHPEELVEQAHALRYSALAITDECSLAGVVRAHAKAKACGLPLIVGTTMVLGPSAAAASPAQPDAAAAADDAAVGIPDSDEPVAASDVTVDAEAGARLVLLAMSRPGYANMVRWVTLARSRAAKGKYLALMSDLEGGTTAAEPMRGMPGCLVLLVATQALASAHPFETLFSQAFWLKSRVGDRAALVLPLRQGPRHALLVRLTRLVARLTGMPIVASSDVLMHETGRKPVLDVLTATRLKCTIAQTGNALQPNAEAYLRSRSQLSGLCPRAWLDNSVRLAARCNFSLDELRYEYPKEIVPDGHTPASWLRQLTERGAVKRFKNGVPDAVRQKIEHELALIGRLEYEAYFLTVADIVRWARDHDILCQGRGSAANSVVCYCLEVTAVDPDRNKMLLFERFVSSERQEPPDIDVDFEHQRREEVIQYIYDRYGRHRAALAAVVISYRPRSALRDAGRALGIDVARIEAVSKGQHWFDGRSIDPQRLVENGFDPESPQCRLWMEMTAALIGFPRHLSQHPGGFVIARDDLAELVPVENATMEKRTVIQWDKDDLESLRLLKVDILALGMLSALRRGLEFVGSKLGAPLQLHEIPDHDEPTFDMLCRADSVGVFQVESRAQMSMLPRLRPRCYYDLVVEVAIVRPGPIQGGMVHPYLKRRCGDEAVDIPSEELKPALERTLGVPIFQEQVMQIAMLAADFTAGEADALRRAMAAWKRKGGLAPFHDRLVGRMIAKRYAPEFAERIFKQIQGFGEYGFPESHAASFALLVYASAWIKCHHPDAFLAALLNSQPMGFYAPAQLVRDAREHGVVVLPVDVLHSEWETVLEGSTEPWRDVRLGLSRISGFPQDAAERLTAARAEAPFASTEDLARRAALDGRELALLAQADALCAITGHRHQAAWEAAGVDARATPMLRATRTHEPAAALPPPRIGDTVLADYRATGLSLASHPVALLRKQLAAFRIQPAAVLRDYPNGRLARASGLVTHRQRPETANGVIFVTLEDETGTVNVIVWPAVVDAQRQPLLASTLLTVYGVWQCQGEVRHLVARKLIDHTPLLQGLTTKSRDFR